MRAIFLIPAHGERSCAIGILLCLCASLPASFACAEGRGGLDTTIDQRGWQEFWERATSVRYPRHDENFIQGKKIFLGQAGKQRIQFCLAEDANAPRVPLSRESLKRYRKMPVTDFVKSLYDCDDPQVHALKKFPPEQGGLIVYYLHRQYKLRLQQNARTEKRNK
ncbi:MAG: hypothetical protein WBN40_04495 [Pseudomonadales bacterium]